MSEDQARAHIEATLWPNGPVCPHCKGQNVYRMAAKEGSKKPGRAGLLRCRDCKKQFTVTVGTIFEGSHIPLNKWLMALHLMTASKKGISAHQLHRMLGVTYKAAWFMCHRLRHTMSHDAVKSKMSGTVEVDETYVGGKHENRHVSIRFRQSPPRKTPVIALVKRNGDVRAFPIKSANAKTLRSAILGNVEKRARIMTDRWHAYTGIGKEFGGGHHTVNHSEFQYVRPGNIHTNTVESYFSLLKRGIMGTFHHISKEHLEKYCHEFSFRWNHRESSDVERANAALLGTIGKRLVYSELQAQGAF
ncbi:MAG: IS1595 family transposase [Elusimicrobia bacterium]|nr:IS1595 family transposase [Elusimicrobiota bacterium]